MQVYYSEVKSLSCRFWPSTLSQLFWFQFYSGVDSGVRLVGGFKGYGQFLQIWYLKTLIETHFWKTF